MLCLTDRQEGKNTKPQSKGSLNLVRLRMLRDGFEQLSFNLISWQKNDTASVSAPQQP